MYAVASQGAIPLVLGGDHSIALPGRDRRGPAPRLRPGLDDPLRRARRHRRHRVRLAVGPRPADAPADRVRRAARRPVPADGAARLLARARDAGLDGRAGHALVRDDRDRQPRARRLPRRGVRDRARRVRRGLPLRRHRRLRPRPRAGHRHARSPAACPRASCSTPYAGSASSCRWPASTWSRCRRPTTTPRSPRSWPTGCAWRRCPGWRPRRSASPTTRPDRCSRAD